jgi:RNA polymerase sigma factor (sigma-70 family)
VNSQATSSGAGAFPNTHWSVVLAAARRESSESAAAMESLCQAYWYPLYAYVRRCGQTHADAQDLTQEFFRRLLEKRWLESVDREKGKLRAFLIVSLKNFMRNEWRHAATQRRGGGLPLASFDTELAQSRYSADPHSLPPEDTYDQQWALTLLDLTVARLQAGFAEAGRPDDFVALKECLLATRGNIDYPAVARRLGVSEGAARVAVHRLRKRFRDIYREEIARTLADDAEVEAEMRHLAAMLARS